MKFNAADTNIYTVEGLSALSEFVRHKPQSIKRIQCQASYREKVKNLLGTLKVPIEDLVSKNTKDKKQAEAPVQAQVEIHYQSLTNLIPLLQKTQKHPLVLALDHITDPRNLGAIARSAAFFGVKYILIPKMRQVLLTPASVSTSQGAFAYTELVLVPNLNQALEKLKTEGFWVISADANGEPYERVLREYQKVVLVLGSEGSGVSDLVKKRSDRVVSIGSKHQILDSLNVSVAAGILLNGFTNEVL